MWLINDKQLSRQTHRLFWHTFCLYMCKAERRKKIKQIFHSFKEAVAKIQDEATVKVVKGNSCGN